MIITPGFILFMLMVFGLVFLFSRSIDKRLWVSLGITVVATPIVYSYVFYPFINIFSSYHHKKYFNSDTWKDKPALRYEMSDDLIKSEFLLNKNKDMVESLLGPSEWYGWDDYLKANSQDNWNYNMGFKPGAFNMQQENLEVLFVDNKVQDVNQYQIKKEFE